MFKKIFIICLLFSSISFSSEISLDPYLFNDIYPTLYVSIETDRDIYDINDIVIWEIYVYASFANNSGISLLGINLNVDQNIILNLALLDPDGNLMDSYYGEYNGFSNIMGLGGTVHYSPNLSQILDICSIQLPAYRVFDIGNDGIPHLFAQGEFIASIDGDYHLFTDVVAAAYWEYSGSDDIYNSTEFKQIGYGSKDIVVLPEPSIIFLLGIGFVIMVSVKF